MANNQNTFIQLPMDVTNPVELRRFLDKLVQQVDVAFGHRGSSGFATETSINKGITSIQELIKAINIELLTYSKLDGSRNYDGIVSYSTTNSFASGSNELVDVNYVESNYEPILSTKGTAFNKDFGTSAGTVTEGGTTTYNPKQSSISSLNQIISNPPTQAEVQAISNKVDKILSTLQLSNIII